MITGIPFISAGNTDSESTGSVMLLGFTGSANTCDNALYVYSKSQGIFIYQTQVNGTAWITAKVNNFGAGSAIIGSISYLTN